MTVQAFPSRLLAKSRRMGIELTLQSHLQQTADAGNRIFESSTRVGRNFTYSFKMTEDEAKQFRLNLQIACLLHDIGKANEGFMSAIERSGDQVVRHEHLSALFMQRKEVRQWLLRGLDERDYVIILGAVLSHHLKASYGNERTSHGKEYELGRILSNVRSSTQTFFHHNEVTAILREIADIANLPSPPELSPELFHLSREPWSTCISEIEQLGRETRQCLEADAYLRKMLPATKAALILADSVASATVRENHSLADWIDSNIHVADLTQEQLHQYVIDKRKQNIGKRKNAPFKETDFQLLASQQPSHTALVAGCGTGKTMAGLLWAANQLSMHGRRFGRVIVLYPTRGTATEGFRDYIAWAPEDECALLHSSSDYELNSMLQNPSDATRDKKLTLEEPLKRLFALATYNRRFVSATVDQFLGFLTHEYGSLCRLPMLTDSVVVVDEIHSFDRQLFRALLEFLRSFDVPVLCMTATLQTERKAELEKLGIRFFPTTIDHQMLVELERQECHPRYKVSWLTDRATAIEDARNAAHNGENVLFVVNTVQRCQELATMFTDLRVIVYHSRFRLCDRTDRHNECVSAFQFDSVQKGIIAITTQVCEMSLDLDADRLITECAPIESLVQRFGRVNRHIQNRPQNFLAPVAVYEPESALPYREEQLSAARNFIALLSARGAQGSSQRELAEAMLVCSKEGRPLSPQASFFNSGIYAVPSDLRDIEAFTVPSVLDIDLDKARTAIEQRLPIDALVVPVPEAIARLPRPHWLPNYLFVAPADKYNKQIGFQAR